MGIPEMLASSSNSGGMESFFNSPIGMILMPRTSARFMEAKKDQMLMAQIQRKQEFAMRFAESIKDKDPLSAAAIMADPSTIDNVLTMYNQDRVWRQHNAIEQQQKMEAEQRAAEIARQAEIDKSNLPGGVGAYQDMMQKFAAQTVQPDGAMANPKVQGPRPEGQLQQGQTVKDMTLPMLTKALSEDFSLPGLAPGDATRIMADPKAVQDLQTGLRTQMETGAKTLEVEIDGEKVKVGYDPIKGTWTKIIGNVPKSAEELKLGSQTIIKRGQDGKDHHYAFVPGEGYTKDEGLAEVKADPNLGDHVEVWDPVKKKTMIMGWDPDDQDFTRVIGEAEPKSGTPMYDNKGNIIGYMGSSGPKGPTEAQQKGISLYEGAKDQYKIAVDNFDELTLPRNSAAASAGSYGRAAMTENGQAAYDAVKQVAQNYIYALSGQQAPDSEVERIMSLVMPSVQDYPTAKKNKKILLHSMMRAIKARLPDKYADDMNKAPMGGADLRVPLPSTTPPPMPKEFSDRGYTQEQWNSLEPSDWDAFLDEDK